MRFPGPETHILSWCAVCFALVDNTWPIDWMFLWILELARYWYGRDMMAPCPEKHTREPNSFEFAGYFSVVLHFVRNVSVCRRIEQR